MWLTADKPSCYASHMFDRADIIKFGYMNYRDDVVPATGRPFKDHPMMMFYMATSVKCPEDFFNEVPAFGWWKSVFPIALQLAWRLGSRRVYLVGCSFQNSQQKPYAWGVRLNEFQTAWSQGTYNDDIVRLCSLKPLFDQHGFQVFSCTPNSRANSILTQIDLDAAITHELSLRPQPIPLTGVKHSSEFRPKAVDTLGEASAG